MLRIQQSALKSLRFLPKKLMSSEVNSKSTTKENEDPDHPKEQIDPKVQAKELEDLTLKIEKQEKEIAELREAHKRVLDEIEGLQIRSIKEIKEKREYAIQKFAKELLDTADVLTLALKAVPEVQRGDNATNANLKSLYLGVENTQKALLKTFSDYGIVGYHPMGHKFDFNLHEALFQAPIPGKEAGTIFHVDKIGYMIKDRILRSAKVGVVQDMS